MTHIIFIAGAGQNKTAWNKVISGLPSQLMTHAFMPTDLMRVGGALSIRAGADAIDNYMTKHDIKQVVICGLSLGAMISTEFTLQHPEKVTSLVLCGGQVRPNPFLMSLQSSIMKLFPEKLLGLPPELTKSHLLAVLHESTRVDFRARVDMITAPTLVVCGARDKPNLQAARYLAGHIKAAKLRIIPGAGHQVNIEKAEELREVLLDFLRETPSNQA